MNSHDGAEALSGKAYLSNALSSSHVSTEAKRILIGIMSYLTPIADFSSKVLTSNDFSRNADRIFLNNDTILKDNSNGSDMKTHLEKGLIGKTSVFASILRCVEKNRRRGEGATKLSNILSASSVMLSVNPREIPAELDTKDFVLNCLNFLSSGDLLYGIIPGVLSNKNGKKRKVVAIAEEQDTTIGKFDDKHEARAAVESGQCDYGVDMMEELLSASHPILRCTQDDTGNLIYSMASDEFTIDSEKFRIRILRLERAFLSSYDVQTMIGRGKRIPCVVDEKAERYLLMSGTTAPPRSASKKAGVKPSMTAALSMKQASAASINTESVIGVGEQAIGSSYNEKANPSGDSPQ